MNIEMEFAFSVLPFKGKHRSVSPHWNICFRRGIKIINKRDSNFKINHQKGKQQILKLKKSLSKTK